MDDADIAQLHERPVEEFARLKPAGPAPKGSCYYCGTPLKFARWCDAECRDGYEYERSRK